jgi:hypothetical protein
MTIKEKFSDPIAEVLDLDSAQDPLALETEYSMVQAAPAQPPAPVEKDAEDIEVDKRIDTVYEAAMDAFRTQTDLIDNVLEPRYIARNAEIAANFLTIALNAAATRARVKTDRRRAGAFAPYMPGKTTNNFIVADRNDLLKLVKVDGERVQLGVPPPVGEDEPK